MYIKIEEFINSVEFYIIINTSENIRTPLIFFFIIKKWFKYVFSPWTL